MVCAHALRSERTSPGKLCYYDVVLRPALWANTPNLNAGSDGLCLALPLQQTATFPLPRKVYRCGLRLTMMLLLLLPARCDAAARHGASRWKSQPAAAAAAEGHRSLRPRADACCAPLEEKVG